MVALAIELRRRGHTCSFAVPDVFRVVLDPLGFACYSTTPDLDPNDKQLIADLMDLRKGSERLLKDVLFPVLRQTVADLRAAVGAAPTLPMPRQSLPSLRASAGPRSFSRRSTSIPGTIRPRSCGFLAWRGWSRCPC
jgi:UDP:flavonoid glycosyltransferase YjiC (YdhE family)